MDLLWRAIRNTQPRPPGGPRGDGSEAAPWPIEKAERCPGRVACLGGRKQAGAGTRCSGCEWVMCRKRGWVVDLAQRGGGSVENGSGPRGAAALAHSILIGDRRRQRTEVETARFRGNRQTGGQLRFQTIPSRPIPLVTVILARMRRRSERRVMVGNGTPAGRLWGGPSGRSVGAPRGELRAFGGMAPMVLPPMMRSNRACRGGRRARCRVPRGGGSSEGRLGGGHRHWRCGCLGHARQYERRRCDHKRDESVSIHENASSHAPGPSGALSPLSVTPFRWSGFPLPHGNAAGSSRVQLTKLLPLAEESPRAPCAESRNGSPPEIAPGRAPEPPAEARADRDRPDSGPRTPG